jgi:hypothetical protein
MSDHAILALIGAVGLVLQLTGLVILALLARESIRLARAVAGLVYQEIDRLRRDLGGRSAR